MLENNRPFFVVAAFRDPSLPRSQVAGHTTPSREAVAGAATIALWTPS